MGTEKRLIKTDTHKGSYHLIGPVFENVFAICRTRDLMTKIGRPVAVYLDNPEAVREADLRSLAGAEWRGSDIPEGMEEYQLPGGRSAVLTYTGPHTATGAAYQVLYGTWLPESGEEPADTPPFEVYLNAPSDTAPDKLITEICLPLKPSAAGFR